MSNEYEEKLQKAFDRVPPNTTPKWDLNNPKTYEPNKERTYYRNDGNKHIKSRGTPC